MRVVELSNHPGAMLAQERERLGRQQEQQEQLDEQWFAERKEWVERTNTAAREEYEAELARHNADVERLREERNAARAKLRWLRSLRIGLRLAGAKRRAPFAPALLPEPQYPLRVWPQLTNETAKLTAGMQSEEDVAGFLAGALGDEWVLLRGYRNWRGEIDQLLLGPVGLIAIEVKYRNATVFCSGDLWRFVKYDQYGNPVEEGEITDRKGRSPSRQLNEPVGQLEEFLAKRGRPIAIRRVVLLTHPQSKLGSWDDDITVDIATDAGYVLELIGELDAVLEPERLEKIEELIVRDHDFHEKKRLRRQGQRS
jgi:hypothetical protein